MTTVDFVAGCSERTIDLVTDAVGEVFDFVIGCKPPRTFSLPVTIGDVTNQFVFITEDGSQVFYTEDGQPFRPE